ncbi:hypothetical protein [Lysinibacillus sp. FSL K6-4013]|uniref:hypothetical protein n=1 Tax=Lysinibacillus sp. FSL K6-4013 TaxID=2921504 RepID=UPI00315A5306
MKLKEFAELLGTLGLPIAYNHFKTTSTNPPPDPPFIVYLEEDSNNFGADNKSWKQIVNYRIEVYSDDKDLDLEEKIEKLLDDNGIFYDTDETYIDQESLYQRMYFITLIK